MAASFALKSDYEIVSSSRSTFCAATKRDFSGRADLLFILMQRHQEAAAFVLKILEAKQSSHAGEVVRMNGAFGSIPFYRSQASKEFTFETLYRRVAFRLADQLLETGEFVPIEDGFEGLSGGLEGHGGFSGRYRPAVSPACSLLSTHCIRPA